MGGSRALAALQGVLASLCISFSGARRFKRTCLDPKPVEGVVQG